MGSCLRLGLLTAIFALALQPAGFAPAEHPYRVIYPEDREVNYREPSQFAAIPLPASIPTPALTPQSTAHPSPTYTPPLLQGAGLRANLAPVVLARINTELSFFQLKDATQQNVRDVIAGYWNLVSARAAAWARRRQVEQATFAFEQADARFPKLGNYGDRSQAKTSLAQFRAQLIAAD